MIDGTDDDDSYRFVNFTLYGEQNFEKYLHPFVPVDLAVDLHNNYIIASKSLVRVYRRTELLFQYVPHYEPKTMELPEIVSISLNKYSEEILLLDRANKVIQTFDNKNIFLYQTDVSEYAMLPSKCHLVDQKTLVLTDTSENSVNVCQFISGSILSCQSHGMYGIGRGEFVNPTSMCSDEMGNVLICDTGNHRLCVMDAHGKFISSLGRLGSTVGCFKSPVSIDIHEKFGVLLVADEDNGRIVIYA